MGKQPTKAKGSKGEPGKRNAGTKDLPAREREAGKVKGGIIEMHSPPKRY